MSKEQIDEMANDIRQAEFWDVDEDCCDLELDRRKTAENLYNAGYRKQEWISVEERLPDGTNMYLVVVKQKFDFEADWRYDTDVATYNCMDGTWNTYNDWDEGDGCEITHWMPLPTPPKMKGGAE